MIAVGSVCALTDVGLKREHNEDSFLVAASLRFFVVADGMGGHLGGETASRLTVEHIFRDVRNHAELLERALPADNVADCMIAKLLGAAFRGANSVVHRGSRDSRELFGMGSTATSVLVRGNRAIVAHVGDSRAYLIRGGRIERLTHDHTIVADQLRDGHITEAAARTSRFKSVMTRAIGCEPDLEVDLASFAVQADDVFLLCSDGLTNLVAEPELVEIVNTHSIVKAAEQLIGTAKHRGGDDNVTVVLVVLSGALSPTVSTEPVAGGAAAGLVLTST